MFCIFSRGIFVVQLVEQEGYARLLIQERISHDMVPYHFKASMNHLIMQDATTQGDFVAEVLWVMAAKEVTVCASRSRRSAIIQLLTVKSIYHANSLLSNSLILLRFCLDSCVFTSIHMC